MFLSITWAKRWLPAILILLSLILPWWMSFSSLYSYDDFVHHGILNLRLSFPWGGMVELLIGFPMHEYVDGYVQGYYWVYELDRIPLLLLVSFSTMLGGLHALSNQERTRTKGGLFGVLGIITYFLFVFHRHPGSFFFSVFGWSKILDVSYTSFISIGFFLALAGSLMLLSPLIKTSIGKIRKRLRINHSLSKSNDNVVF